MVAKMVTLSYFDVKKEITIQCDASSYGLGASFTYTYPDTYEDRTELCGDRIGNIGGFVCVHTIFTVFNPKGSHNRVRSPGVPDDF
jgi:hypothetical protein